MSDSHCPEAPGCLKMLAELRPGLAMLGPEFKRIFRLNLTAEHQWYERHEAELDAENRARLDELRSGQAQALFDRVGDDLAGVLQTIASDWPGLSCERRELVLDSVRQAARALTALEKVLGQWAQLAVGSDEQGQDVLALLTAGVALRAHECCEKLALLGRAAPFDQAKTSANAARWN